MVFSNCMSDLVFLLIILVILAASFIFWKLSRIKIPQTSGLWISQSAKRTKMRGRCLIPLRWRITASLTILLLIPALILFGMAIAIIVAIGLLVAMVAFILSLFRPN